MKPRHVTRIVLFVGDMSMVVPTVFDPAEGRRLLEAVRDLPHHTTAAEGSRWWKASTDFAVYLRNNAEALIVAAEERDRLEAALRRLVHGVEDSHACLICGESMNEVPLHHTAECYVIKARQVLGDER